MASRTAVEIIFPISRLVWGSVHTARTKQDDNNVDRVRDDGTLDKRYEFGTAVPKTAGATHWNQEQGWGQTIWTEGTGAWPAGETQRPDFSWKITDGDSTVPNSEGNRPADKEANRGCWIINFSSMSAPQLFNAIGVAQPTVTLQNDIMLPGDFVQVVGTVVGNDSKRKPGVYMNHRAVCFKGYHPGGRIASVAAVSANVFGAGAAAGAVMAPVGGMAAPAPTAPTPAPAAPVPPAAAPAPVAPPAPTAVTPDSSYVPTPSAAPRMAHKDGHSWPVASMTGWTEATLLQNGYTLTGG